MVSFMATIAIVWGIIPEFSISTSRFSFSTSSYSQDFSDDQINRYARSVIQIETQRQQAYQTISGILGKSPPTIVCNNQDTFKALPNQAQKIAVDYCNNSKKIVENSGLTPAQFNSITARVRSDNNFKKRVQNALIRVQQNQKATVK
ncbi:MAG: hypothetical protein N5P05_003261 [Chroococcopsis gigantea SAG 12.99]|nr:hypothetical protein [Chroococcopsis gigantea SAG 12.99]